MNNKPIIGIVGRYDIATEDYSVMCCYENIRRSVIKKGGIPILILPSQDLDYESVSSKELDKLTIEQKNDLIKVIDICNGILMPGSYRVFEYDKFIYEYSLKKDIPILGICAGMQLMALVDNPLSRSTEIIVKNNTEINHFQRGEKYVHKVNIIKDSLLYKILHKEETKVNSRHNYHIEKTKDLKICGYSEDGLVEAFEYLNKKFVLGVEWHPESMLEYDDDSNKIFEAFINSCK
jgi:putative glutamine amidotransferase